MDWIFFPNQALFVFLYYGVLSSCKILEKSLEPLWRQTAPLDRTFASWIIWWFGRIKETVNSRTKKIKHTYHPPSDIADHISIFWRIASFTSSESSYNSSCNKVLKFFVHTNFSHHTDSFSFTDDNFHQQQKLCLW